MADREALSRESYPDPPTLVGLCPGDHLGEFYMPIEPGDGVICPMCSERMIVYAPLPDDQVPGFHPDRMETHA